MLESFYRQKHVIKPIKILGYVYMLVTVLFTKGGMEDPSKI